jgi:hypothetical protein
LLPELLNVNVSVAELVGDPLGLATIDGVAGPLAPSAPETANPPATPNAARTLSNTKRRPLVLRAVLSIRFVIAAFSFIGLGE